MMSPSGASGTIHVNLSGVGTLSANNSSSLMATMANPHQSSSAAYAK